LLRLARHDEFLSALDRLVPEGRLGIAVSGGPDSVALLLLAATARPGAVWAATVDHGLRTESAAEAAGVARICAGLDVPHDTLSVQVGEGASVQAQARTARYAALGRWARECGLAAVATGHHADDQAETLLMRLARGSGVGGLAGIRESRELVPGVALVRPLLGWRRVELRTVVDAAGLHVVDDPANRDERHDRTRARTLLADAEWFDPVRVARSAAALAQADSALSHWAEALAAVHLLAEEEGGVRLCRMEALHPELRRRLLIQALGRKPGEPPSGPELDRALAALASGQGVTLRGSQLSASGGDWLVRPAPPRRQTPP
jgi:tRNA(Ile)-lysidine synthase